MRRSSAFWHCLLAPGTLSAVLLCTSASAAQETAQPNSDPNEAIQQVQAPEQPAVSQPLPTPSAADQAARAGTVGQVGGDPFGSVGTGRAPTTDRGTADVSPATSFVGGAQAQTRATTDAGDLLIKSQSGTGVEAQRRTPIVTDPRIRGYHIGQINTFADDAFFFPARQDLDTIVSKIYSGLISDVAVIKGPYSVRYGPGLAFLDIQTLDSPRYQNGFEAHESTTLSYKTNGEQWHGLQQFWGGGSDWGFRLNYDMNVGNSYETGGDFHEPSNYNSQYVLFAAGFDLSPDSRIELKGLRLDQHDVLFPGQIFDIDHLITDAYSIRYILQNQEYFDRLTFDTWYNYTRFSGNDLNPSTRATIPQIDNPTFQLNAFTDADSISTGFRQATTWGKEKCPQLTLGIDLHYLSQHLNEFDNLFFPPQNTGVIGAIPAAAATQNAPIPRSHELDPGLFVDGALPVGESLLFKAGTRFDTVWANIEHTPPLTTDFALSSAQGNPTFDRQFSLWSAYATGEYKLAKNWTTSLGFGTAERPPTLTELYAAGPFLAVVQNGLTSVFGNAALLPERSYQADVGLRADYQRFRAGLNGFYAWINNYITFENEGQLTVNGKAVPGFSRFQFVNTDLATLAGGEAYSEIDVTDWLTPFGTLAYVEGLDHTRDNRGILFGTVGAPQEPLPGIPPLEAHLGVRIHEARKDPRWGVEITARIVDEQERIAQSLLEQFTGGFTVYDLRSYWQANKNLLLTAGVENFTNKLYHEHLDLRTGLGVFQPGVNFYLGAQLQY
jgi:outer membrane receptor protein involved in Fe transport